MERDLGVGHQAPAGLQAESPAVWPSSGSFRVRNRVLGQRGARRKSPLALYAAFQETFSRGEDCLDALGLLVRPVLRISGHGLHVLRLVLVELNTHFLPISSISSPVLDFIRPLRNLYLL